jgi:hypothetical protein
MEVVLVERKRLRLRLRDDDACQIGAFVELGPDAEPSRRARVSDELYSGLGGAQRLASPVRRDVTEEAVFGLVPLARARREVRHVHANAEFVGKVLDLDLPCAGAMAVAPSRIGSDEQL